MAEHFISKWRDERVVARGTRTVILPSAGSYAVTIIVPDLKYVEIVLQYKFTCDPICDPGTPTNEKITGNVVGFTLIGVGDGTTLTTDLIAVGP